MENKIEKYLHHRAPYIQVDSVIESNSSKIVTRKTVKPDEFYIDGHFPGAPVVPGAMLQEMCTQSAGILIAQHYNPMKSFDTSNPYHNEIALGVLRKVESAKYTSFARVNDELVIEASLVNHLDHLFKFEASVSKNKQKIMQIKFSLCNIPSKLLQ